MLRFILFLLLLPTTCTLAQTNLQTAQLFRQWYNAQQYDSIFQHFTPATQQALPLADTRQLLTSVHTQEGALQQLVPENTKNGWTFYKAIFQRGVLRFQLANDASGMITGYGFSAYTNNTLPKPSRNTTAMQLPFSGQWYVVWGGDTPEQNYHVESVAQKNAFDILQQDDAHKTHRGNGQRNEDYYAFGQPITAPCDAVVAYAVDGVKDNIPGKMNTTFITGNTVVLETATHEFVYLCHLQQFSVAVKQGQKVKAGQLLGKCGNSGHSSEPHLHFHLENTEDMEEATGIKCYFSTLQVNGKPRQDYSPVQGDVIAAH